MMTQSMKKQRSFLILVAFLLLLTLPNTILADSHGGSSGVESYEVNIPPRATIEVAVNGYCLNRGLPFPGETMAAVGLAPEDVQVAIGHIVENDYITQDLYQTQLAIWHLTDGETVPEQTDLANDIIAFAQSGATPVDANAESMSLAEAINQGLVTAEVVNYENIAPPPYFYFGEGSLVITNLTDEEVTLHIPYGMTFTDETQEGVQDMGIFPKPNEEESCDPLMVDVPANSVIEVKVCSLCSDRVELSQETSFTLVKTASDDVRNSICYSLQEGYLSDDPYQTQEAVWTALDGQAPDAAYPLANKIVEYAASGATPGDIGTNGLALPDAVSNGTLSVTMNDYQQSSLDPNGCFAQGILSISDLSGSDQMVYLPAGMIFEDANQAQIVTFACDDAAMAAIPEPVAVEAETPAETETSAPTPAEETEELPQSGASLNYTLLLVALLLGAGISLMITGYMVRHQA